jgi:acyl dehydratase
LTAELVGSELPSAVSEMVGVAMYEEESEIPVERGYIWTSCASVENGNPLYWDDEVADRITGGPIAPPTMLSVWFRPHFWAPGRQVQRLPLQVHFDLKERLDLPEAVMTSNTMAFYEPIRIGDRLRTKQVLRSVSPLKRTKLGTGRFWVIDVVYENQRSEMVGMESYTGFGYRREDTTEPNTSSGADGKGPGESGLSPQATDVSRSKKESEGSPNAGRKGSRARLEPGEVPHAGEELPPLCHEVTATTVVLGAMASRDWRPMHHDKDFAQYRNGVRDIFLNTPNQAAWFERYVTDWTGPYGRLGTMAFVMKGSVFPGDRMELTGQVTSVGHDETGCLWAELDVTLSVASEAKTTCAVRVALPSSADDNPWRRRGEMWRPMKEDTKRC